MNDEQLKVILTAILNHHLDNIQDLNFEGWDVVDE